MNNKPKQLKGSIAALLVNIIFGFSFLFSKVALNYAHPLVILAVRFTVAFAVLNLLWLFGVFKLNFKGKDKKLIILMSLAQPILYYVFELYGIDNTSSAMSGIIISLEPVAVIILATLFLKEKPTKSQVIFTILSLVSIVIISILSDNGVKNKLFGIILLAGATLCAAIFSILSRKTSTQYSPFERTYIMFLVGTVGFNAITFASLRGDYANEIASASCHIEFWGAIFYLAVISSIVAFMLFNYATGVITPVRSASFSNLITVVSVLAGILILGEPMMSPVEILCCLAVIIGVMGVNK